MDGLGENRRQMLYNIEGVMSAADNEKRFSAEGQLNLFDEMGDAVAYKPQEVEEMSEEMLLALEKEATGLYLSGHPMEKYTGFTERLKAAKTVGIQSGKYRDGERLTVAGIISDFRVRQLKNNNLMGVGLLEDIYGSVNITVFANALNEFRALLSSNKPLLLSGKLSEREDRDAELIIERAEEIPETAKGLPTSKKYKSGLYLKIKSTDCPEFSEVKKALARYHGSTAVIIYCTDTKRKLEAPESLKIELSDGLIGALAAILGTENVKFIK